MSESVFEKAAFSWPPPDEGCACRDDVGFRDRRELLVVASEAAVLHDLGECLLHHPEPWQNLEILGSRVATDDLQKDMSLVFCPFDEATGIDSVGIGTLHEGEAGPRALQHALVAVAILYVSVPPPG